MPKLSVGWLVLLVIICTLAAAAAGLLFGANLGGNYGCFAFAGQTGYIACAYAFALIGAGIGFVLSLVLGLLLKRLAALLTLIIILMVLFAGSALPPVIAAITGQPTQDIIESVNVTPTINTFTP